MAQCRYINSCTHATGWCNSQKVWKSCEYINDICGVTHLPCSYCNPVCSHRIINRKDDVMEEKKYECSYCGHKYIDPVNRANCELSCNKKKLAEEEKTRWEQYHKEKQDRENKIKSMRKELSDLEKKFYDDYREQVYVLREPVIRTVDFNGDWGKFFEDCFSEIK